MKQFKNLILAGALVLGLAGFAVSCDKYGDDIDELTSRVGKLETQLTDLQTKIDAGVIVTGVTQTAGGVTIQTSNGTYTITNGEKGEKGEKGDKGDQGEKGQGSVVTLGENGNWFIDGVDTKIPYKGEKGDKGEDGKASVVEIGENGNWFIDGVDTGVKAGADGALSAVWDPEARTIILKNVERYEGDYVLNLTAAGVTSVELVASIDGANITNKINFATVTEKENVFGIVDPEDGKTLLPGGLKFTEGAETQRDVNVIVRVSPVNYALKAEDVSFQNGNGETLDWVKVVSVEPYKRLYTATRAGEPETGLWKIKVALAKDYVKKDFEKATKVGKKDILFAVKAQDAVSTYDVAFVYEVPKPLSKLDVVVDNDNDIKNINNRYYGSGRLSGRNYYITSESFADGGDKVFTYKEKAWAADTAYTATASGNFVEATGDPRTDKVSWDNRNTSPAYEAFKGTPITITIPAFKADGKTLAYDKSGRLIPNENIRAMYVTLDYEACAVESAPSEWVSWNSYTYTGLNEVVEGAETEIIIDSDKAINDYIGFRVYAVNYDGTLVDPDGRAFYVKLGEDTPAVDWNKGTVPATTVTPLANPDSYAKQNPDAKPETNVFSAQKTSSDPVKVSLTGIDGAASYKLELLDEDNEPTTGLVPFSVTLASEDPRTSCDFTFGGKFDGNLADVDFTKLTKVSTTPTVAWNKLVDGKTYTAKLTIYDNVDHALATLTVSMTKVMPEEDPKGAFVFKSEKLDNGTFYAYMIPHSGDFETAKWDASANISDLSKVWGIITKVSDLYITKPVKTFSQDAYYYHVNNINTNPIDVRFAQSTYKDYTKPDSKSIIEQGLFVGWGENNSLCIPAAQYKTSDGAMHSLIDNESHGTFVVYNYGEISSVVPKSTDPQNVEDALKKLDGKAGAFVVNTSTSSDTPKYEYFVKVRKVNTAYCSVYGHGYSWNFATREQLNALHEQQTGSATTMYTDKKDGKYTHELPYKSEVTFGEDLVINPSYIYGTSSWDGRYNRPLKTDNVVHASYPSGFDNSLTLKKDKDGDPVAYVEVNGTKDEYYHVKSITNLDNSITLAAIDEDNNITHDVVATLVIECLDMYDNEVKVTADFTIKKR